MSNEKITLTKVHKILIALIAVSLLSLAYVLVGPAGFNLDKLTMSQHQVPEDLKPDPANPQSLMPDRNHNHAAASYAYDVKDIQAYLTGEKTYTGSQKLVFLTFDDGANHKITPGVLDVLKEHGVPATFFPIGAYITPETADLYQRQIREGHALALHSYYHDFGLLYPYGVPDTKQILEEARATQKTFKSFLGLKFKTRVWRYPGGLMSWEGLEETNAQLAQEDIHWIDWNSNVGDAEGDGRRPQTVEDMLAFEATSPASFEGTPEAIRVVLMHDTSDKQLTLDTLPLLIQRYKDAGYTFGVLY